jgi:hypothetical protein
MVVAAPKHDNRLNDPMIIEIATKLDAHIEQTNQSFSELRQAATENRESVDRLAQEFREHDVQEMGDRKILASAMRGLTVEVTGLRTELHDYKVKMRPAEDGIAWLNITRKGLVWVASVLAAAAALWGVFH